MRNINLRTGDEEKILAKRRRGAMSMTLGLLIMVITIVIYGGAFYYSNALDSKKESIEQQIVQAKSEYENEDFKEVYNFQARLAELGKIIDKKKKNALNLDLENISKHTLPDTYFETFNSTLENGEFSIAASIVVPDNYYLAKQIEAYGLVKEVEKVVMNSSEYVDGKIEAAILISVKKNELNINTENNEL